MRPEAANGGIVYSDGQFDDARLAIALARTFEEQGGIALNYFECVAFLKDARGRIAGIEMRDVETGELFLIKSRGVVNATGVFVDRLRRLDESNALGMIAPSQGAHIVLDRSFLPGDTAVLVPKTDDGRVLFAIPWLGRTLVGTTDTPVSTDSLRNIGEPRPFREEVDYLINYTTRYLIKTQKRDDILSAFRRLASFDRFLGAIENGTLIARSRDDRFPIGTGDDRRRQVDDVSPHGARRRRSRRGRSRTSFARLPNLRAQAPRLDRGRPFEGFSRFFLWIGCRAFARDGRRATRIGRKTSSQLFEPRR